MLLLQIFRHGAVASVSGAGGNVGVPGCQVAWLVDEDVELLIRFSADMHFCQEGAEAGALIPAPSNCCSGWSGCAKPFHSAGLY